MTFDDVARHNKDRWEELSAAGVQYSRPWLKLTAETARAELDPEGVMGELTGRDVLCLTASGGQQSVACAMLGARRVVVVDFAETQLARDREAAVHYGFDIETIQGDMRDLSCFPADTFDIVWHAHSLNFIPGTREVFDEVVRVLRPGGLYRLSCWNPIAHGVDAEGWDGRGYPLVHPHVDGAEVTCPDPHWEFEDGDGRPQRVGGPREFRHTLSTLANGLIGRGFKLLGIWEHIHHDPAPEPGSWRHFGSFAPPWLTFWARYEPPLP